MTDKYLLIECFKQVNEIIKQPLQQTQRIKFTTFDVSEHYLVFGATSGGIYIFSRFPCEFIKLVPTKEGSISQLAISPDEKSIAISSIRGLIVIVSHCFSDTNVRYQLYSEHKSQKITDILWNQNELYCGDHLGNVSVIILNNVLAKAIFQSPSAILMNLESPIVQLDIYSKFLLVSTKTKTYLCDTDAEQYRQIGKKLRDGDFGACFYTNTSEIKNNAMRASNNKQKNTFKNLKDHEHFCEKDFDDGAKIFCARPGLRIWQVNFDANVNFTYEFKQTINQGCNEIIHFDENSLNTRLEITVDNKINDINFGKLLLIGQKFLLTYTKQALIILDATTCKLLFKTHQLQQIAQIKLINNCIYVWSLNKDLKVLILDNLEGFIVTALGKQCYQLCAELCLKYREIIETQIEVSDKLRLITILDNKITDKAVHDQLEPLMKTIKDFEKQSITSENGIITDLKILEPKVNVLNDRNYQLNILYRQFKMGTMYNDIEIPKLNDILHALDVEISCELFQEFEEFLNNKGIDKREAKLWCFNWFIKYLLKITKIDNFDVESPILKYLFNTFIELNASNNICPCGYPLPATKGDKILHYNPIGCDLYKLNPNAEKNLCSKVPGMWKYALIYKSTSNELDQLLPLLVQFGDGEIYETFRLHLNYDKWEDCLRLYLKLRSGICLNCNRRITYDTNEALTWKEFGCLMVNSLGGSATVKLLTRYAQYVPNTELGNEFYQYCILVTVLKGENCTGFVRGLRSHKIDNTEFEKSLQKYLTNKHAGKPCTRETVGAVSRCSLCDLTLQNPILDEPIKFQCGHIFHKMCLDNNQCSLCVGL